MAKKKNDESDLILLGKRKAISSARLKASVKNGSLFSDSDTKAPRTMKKAKKEKKATKGTKQKHKGRKPHTKASAGRVRDGGTMTKLAWVITKMWTLRYSGMPGCVSSHHRLHTI